MTTYNGRYRINTGIHWDAAGHQLEQDGPVVLTLLEAQIDFETVAEAKEFAALFPKYVKVNAGRCSTFDRNEAGHYTNYDIGSAHLSVYLKPDKTTGAVNETGLKRFRKFLAVCSELGYLVTREHNWKNSIDFEL